MINEDTFKNLNIKGENILKNNNDSSIANYSLSNISDENINNFILNSNLDNMNSIK